MVLISTQTTAMRGRCKIAPAKCAQDILSNWGSVLAWRVYGREPSDQAGQIAEPTALLSLRRRGEIGHICLGW